MDHSHPTLKDWDPAIVVGEGLEADGLLDALLKTGQDFAAWWPEVEKRGDLLSWGLAWVALERGGHHREPGLLLSRGVDQRSQGGCLRDGGRRG